MVNWVMLIRSSQEHHFSKYSLSIFRLKNKQEVFIRSPPRNTLILHDGHVRWSGDGHDSGFDSYDYAVVAYLHPRTGSKQAPIVHVHQGHVAGTIEPGPRDDPWDMTQQNDLVGAYYDDYEGGRLELNTQYSSGILNAFESVLNSAIKWTIGSLLDGAGLMIFLGVEVASLIDTGSLVAGARVLNGVLWMAGPGNTLLAIVAGGIATAGSRIREISQAEYDWANREVFNGTLPPRSNILLTDTKGYNNRAFTFPRSDGKITVNVGGMPGMYDNPMGSFKGTFIHELVHAWQVAHTPMQLTLLADAFVSQVKGSVSYVYPPAGPAFKEFNLEQQAQIVQDWFTNGKHEDSTYFRYIRDNIMTGQWS